MSNSVKKQKTSTILSLVAKLMVVVAAFGVVSCGCGGGGNPEKAELTFTISDITDGKTDATLNIKTNQNIDDLTKVKLTLEEAKRYSAADFKTEITTGNAGDEFEVLDAKGNNISGKNLKELTNKDKLEKDKTVDVKLTLKPGTNVKGFKVKFVATGDEALKSKATKDFSWSKP